MITNIGLDHCDLLGNTLEEIAFEKAGIIKPSVKVVVGESRAETDAVFERKVLYTNLPEPQFMGNHSLIMSLLTYADKTEPHLWECSPELLRRMDLQGIYQKRNLRTVLASVELLRKDKAFEDCDFSDEKVCDAIIHTAERMEFHGRWEKLSDSPCIICDIGHNEHGLRYNFSQLSDMLGSGEYSDLIIVYGSVADKDVDAVMHLLPSGAHYIFTNASSRRALAAEEIMDKYLASCSKKGTAPGVAEVAGNVPDAVRRSLCLYDLLCSENHDAKPLIYIGGSTYVVSEAVEFISHTQLLHEHQQESLHI